MKIAIFDPSDSFRALFKATINNHSPDIEWSEFEGLTAIAIDSLKNKYDIVVTARELKEGSFSKVVKLVRKCEVNKETPVFLFTAENSSEFFDKAFQYGVTDIYSKSDLGTATETFSRMISFSSSVSGANILIVEDDSAISSYYAQVFSEMDFVVHQTSTCDEAQALLNNHPIELLITDLHLDSGGQGQRVIRELRHSRARDEQGIPIMVMSSSSAPQYKTCLFYLGIDEYIVKPILPKEICLRAIHLVQKYRAEKAAIEQASHFKEIAHYDSLTSAYSRHGFLDVAQFCVANCKRQETSIGLLYLDLDDFKPVNDKLGHATGDKVLASAVSLLKSLLREQDVVCRWGGDEFVVLLQNCNDNHLEIVAHRIKDEFSEQKENLHDVGCSIGISYGSPHSIASLLTIIDQADKAMYVSKKKQKGMITLYSRVKSHPVMNKSRS